jgi:DNA-binding transcriptional LysR family regulator
VDIRELKYAVSLAEELHFGRAARRHFISEQPFGKRIRTLEEALGVQLFERTSRRVALTPAGTLVIAEARRLLASADRIAALAAQSPDASARLRLGVLGFGAADMWPRIQEVFSAEDPHTRLDYVDLDYSTQHSSVRDGLVDVAICQFVGDSEGLQFDVLFESPRMVMAPSSSPLAALDRFDLRFADAQDWVGVTSSHEAMRKWLGSISTQLRGAPTVERPAALPAAVATTGRLALYCATAAVLYPFPGVSYIPVEGAPLEVALVTRAGDDRPAVQALRRAARLTARAEHRS